jgi:hypothetical protein
VFDIDDARDGDVEQNFPPIVFEAPDGPASKVCTPVCTACTTVEIRDDFIIEDKFEYFGLSLSHRDDAVNLTSTNISVTIEDEDSKSSYTSTVTAIVTLFLYTAVELTWGDSQPFAITLDENSTIVPRFTVRRVGLSAVDTIVRLVPQGLTATGK